MDKGKRFQMVLSVGMALAMAAAMIVAFQRTASAVSEDHGKTLAEAASETQVRVTFIGDSITQGSGVYGAAVRGAGTYPAIAGELLKKTSYREYTVTNRGYSGWCLANNTNAPYMKGNNGSVYQDALQNRADVYFIALGTNDSKYKSNDDNNMGNMGSVMDGSFFTDYCTMVEQIHSSNENARVYAVLPVPSLAKTLEAWDTPGTINETRLRIVREVIKAVGEKYSYVDVLDMNRAFLDVIEGEMLAEGEESQYNADNPALVKNTTVLPEGFNSYATPNGIYLYDNSLGDGSGTISIDGIHPGQAGVQRMAKTVAAALEGEKKYLNPEYDWSVDVPEIATGEMRKQEEAEPGEDGRIGDADGNGALSLADAVTALKISVEAKPEKETAAYRSADVDQDGMVDTSDVRRILMKVNGKEVPGIRWMEPVSSSKPAQDNTFNLFDAEWTKDDAYEVSFDS